MRKIFGYHALWVGEGKLRHAECNAVLVLVLLVLLPIPFEPGLCQNRRLTQIWVDSHMIIWRIGDGYRELNVLFCGGP